MKKMILFVAILWTLPSHSQDRKTLPEAIQSPFVCGYLLGPSEFLPLRRDRWNHWWYPWPTSYTPLTGKEFRARKRAGLIRRGRVARKGE